MMRLKNYIHAILVLCFLSAISAYGNEPATGEDGRILFRAAEAYDPADDFILANRLYSESNYGEAALVYERIIGAGYHSAGLYYNLGNAYYRSNNIPAAILNYERAALLSPGDEDVRFNLELARSRVRDRIEELPAFFLNRWWQDARSMAGSGAWAVLSVSLFILSLAMVSVFLFSSSIIIKKTFFWLAVSMFSLAVLCFSLGLDQRNHLRNHGTAIVFSPLVPVKSSPDIRSADLFIIHEGTKVRVEESIGDWRSVRLSDGNKGWVHMDDIEMI